MTEKDLIKTIKELKEIRPSEDWVVLTKNRILGPELKEHPGLVFGFSFHYKPALIPILVFFILIGVFGFAQNTVPGDFLYPVKRIAEATQINLSSEIQRPKVRLELVNKRLEELNHIAERNLVQNLAPAIEEFQANAAEAAKDLVKIKEPEKNPQIVKEIAGLAKKLEKNKEKVEALGVVVGETEELDNALGLLVEREIESLENQSLTEIQQSMLEEAKDLYRQGLYSEALEKILMLSNNQY